MSANFQTRRLRAEETIDLRWEVLRPGFPRETARFPGDDQAVHLGVFCDERLIGVASLYDVALQDCESEGRWFQLRGMATSPEARGTGAGRQLLSACETAALEEGVPRLWCNARRSAVGFYQKHGWEICSEEFEIPTVGPHVRMRRNVSDRPTSAQPGDSHGKQA